MSTVDRNDDTFLHHSPLYTICYVRARLENEKWRIPSENLRMKTFFNLEVENFEVLREIQVCCDSWIETSEYEVIIKLSSLPDSAEISLSLSSSLSLVYFLGADGLSHHLYQHSIREYDLSRKCFSLFWEHSVLRENLHTVCTDAILFSWAIAVVDAKEYDKGEGERGRGVIASSPSLP